jgi:hypothetical protein
MELRPEIQSSPITMVAPCLGHRCRVETISETISRDHPRHLYLRSDTGRILPFRIEGRGKVERLPKTNWVSFCFARNIFVYPQLNSTP